MGNAGSLCGCRTRKVGSIKEITLLMIGLDNAGKTCAVKHLQGEPTTDAVPTVGFTSIRLKHDKYSVCIYDVGGGPHIRDIWKNYYALVHGIIIVVDSTVPERIDECKSVISKVLKDRRVAGKPVLLYFNKQDMENAVDETELVCRLELEKLVNEQHCPTRVEGTCAIFDDKKVKDPGIWEGFNWLIGHIGKEFKHLQERVYDEKTEQMRLEEQDRQQRIARVQKLREERLRLQQQQEEERAKQQKLNGCAFATVHEEEDDDDKDVIIQNPFKPVNVIRTELEQRMNKSPNSHPAQSSKENNELILQPPTASPSHHVPNHQMPGVHLSSNLQGTFSSPPNGDTSKKLRSQKMKKRFKNRVVPQASDTLVKTVETDLPPLKSAEEASNCKLKWQQQPLANGHANLSFQGSLSLSEKVDSVKDVAL